MGKRPDTPKDPVGSLPAASVGRVIQTDRRTFVVSVKPGLSLRHRDFVEVPFSRSGKTHTLVGQVDLLVGEDVKIGSTRRSASISVLGIGGDLVETKDIAKTQVRATAKITAFLDSNGAVSVHDPTIEYMGQPAYPASPESLRRVFSTSRSPDLVQLEVGFLLGTTSVTPVVFDPAGLMRHTAVFGQSGSGKSYSFGILLEELISKTEARVVVFDPNADYRSFTTIRPRAEIIKNSRREYSLDEHELFSKKWKELSTAFFRFSRDNDGSSDPLELFFSDLSRSAQVQLLGLDPVLDREEYAAFRETVESLGESYTLQQVMHALSNSPSVEKVRLLYRFKNRELDKMALWGPQSLIGTLRSKDWRLAIVDVRDVSPLERWLAASAVLQGLYRDIVFCRRVTFLVVDEAHNFCPAETWDQHQEGPRKIIHEISAEGRKYGAFLMLLTQNPSKLSPQALLQCDNVILMRMTSGVEVQAIEAVVEDGGPRLARVAFKLGKGEALCMGGFVTTETSVKFDLRKTEPGGDDVSKAWARRNV